MVVDPSAPVVPDTPAPARPDNAPAPAAAQPAAVAPEPVEPEVPKFFHRPEPAKAATAAEDEFTPDLAGLPPEALAKVEEIKRGFQSAATRKFQAIADEKRKWEEERKTQLDRISDLLDRASKPAATPEPKETPSTEPNPMELVKQLREEGRSDEAEEMFLKILDDRQKQLMEPIRQEREREQRINTFIEVKDAAFASPMVKRYEKAVTEVWDSGTPIMQAIRKEILATPERIKTFVPMVFQLIATEQHAKFLEANMEKIVENRVKAEFARTKGIPSSLVEKNGQPKETKFETNNRRAAVQKAWEQLTGQTVS